MKLTLSGERKRKYYKGHRGDFIKALGLFCHDYFHTWLVLNKYFYIYSVIKIKIKQLLENYQGHLSTFIFSLSLWLLSLSLLLFIVYFLGFSLVSCSLVTHSKRYLLYFVQHFKVFRWEAFRRDVYFSTLQDTKAFTFSSKSLQSGLPAPSPIPWKLFLSKMKRFPC